MRVRTSLGVFVVFVLLMSNTATVMAIKNGELDGNDHPYVGLMVADDADGNPLWRCSGTLLDSTHFLTAGHCTEAPAARATIWFESDVESGIPGNGYPFGGATSVDGTTYTHPNFSHDEFILHDLGMVVLDEPVVMSEYGALPALDVLDQMATQRGSQDVSFTSVGYGLQHIIGPQPVMLQAERVRMVSYPKLNQINAPGVTGDYAMLLSNNANTGGTCFGDSGGPNFIGDSNVIGGVTSFGLNFNCAGAGGVYRVDRQDDLDWLATFDISSSAAHAVPEPNSAVLAMMGLLFGSVSRLRRKR